MSLFMLQSPPAPSLPWWVLYLVLIGITCGTWRTARLRWWAGCLVALMGWMFIPFAAVLPLPASRWPVTLLVTCAPLLAWLAGIGWNARRGGRAEACAPAVPRLPPAALQGQPAARAVLRSKLM